MCKVLVTRKCPGGDTAWVEQQPLTFPFLNHHLERLRAAVRRAVHCSAMSFWTANKMDSMAALQNYSERRPAGSMFYGTGAVRTAPGLVPQLNCEQLRGLRTFLRARSALSWAVMMGKAVCRERFWRSGRDRRPCRLGGSWVYFWLAGEINGRVAGTVDRCRAGGRLAARADAALHQRCGGGAVPADGAMVCWHARRNR